MILMEEMTIVNIQMMMGDRLKTRYPNSTHMADQIAANIKTIR